jgi:hypothetical protein
MDKVGAVVLPALFAAHEKTSPVVRATIAKQTDSDDLEESVAFVLAESQCNQGQLRQEYQLRHFVFGSLVPGRSLSSAEDLRAGDRGTG